MGEEQSAAADAFALAMLTVIFVSMGVVAMLFFCMRRNASRRNPHVDELIEEISLPPRPAETTHAETARPAPWEKNSDWWKA